MELLLRVGHYSRDLVFTANEANALPAWSSHSVGGRERSGVQQRLHAWQPLQDPCWRIPWTEEPGGLQSMGPRRVSQD